jgi:hypothetical protein
LSDVVAVQQSAEPIARAGTIEAAVEALQRDRESAKAPTPEQAAADVTAPEASDPVQVDSADGGVEQVETAEAPVEEEALEDADTKDPLYRIEVDGEERDLTAEQLSEAVMLKADYTRKTQALAEERRQVATQAQQINSLQGELTAKRQEFIERGQQYDAALHALQKLVVDADNEFAKVDWEAEEAADPIATASKWRRYQQSLARKQALDAETQRRAQEQAELAQQVRAERARHMAAVWRERHPEFLDPEVGRKRQERMLRTLAENGFEEAEVGETLDPRIWELIYKAALYDDLQSAKSSATAVTPKAQAKGAPPRPITVVRPGSPRPSSARTARATEVAQLSATAKRTGDINAVFALMQARQQNASRR